MRDKGMIEAAWAGKTNITYDDPFAGRENQRIRFIVWDMLGCMPGLSDEHCAEFYYQTTGTQANRDLFTMHYDRIEDRQNSVTRLREQTTAVLQEIHPSLTLHDFRVVFGEQRSNLIFDVVVPYDIGDTSSLASEIERRLQATDPSLFVVLTIDREWS
jgi:hypothetical protein